MTTPPDNTGEKPDTLSFIKPRDTLRAAKARDPRLTRFVARLKFALPIAGVLLLVALVVWPWVDPNKLKAVVMKNVPDLVVEDLHFTGLDSKNEPYSMISKRATRPSGMPNTYDLNHPEGEITLASGAWIAGKAEYGRYDQEKRLLWLGGNVQMFHDKGYQFTTDAAQVDIDERDAWGEAPVLIQGDFGEIRGKGGFRLLDSGHTMIVLGPAKALLNLHAGPASDTPADTKKP